MRSITEANRWLRDAEACLASAQWALDAQDYRVAVQNAQLCVEYSAKAVIAQLAEPLWRHDPSPQLRRLLETHEEVIIQRCGGRCPQRCNNWHQMLRRPLPGTVGSPISSRYHLFRVCCQIVPPLCSPPPDIDGHFIPGLRYVCQYLDCMILLPRPDIAMA